VNNCYPIWLIRASWLAVILWAATIYYLSSLSGSQIEKIGIHVWDKAAHFLAFFSGAVVLTCALRCFDRLAVDENWAGRSLGGCGLWGDR
jgi:VanZ family protein